jgi:hypothetical protein
LADSYTLFGNAMLLVAKSAAGVHASPVSNEYAEALKWYNKAADIGSAAAMSNIGFCYRNGDGVSKDYARAVDWFRKAADGGDKKGMFGLGYMYEEGWAVRKDYT